MEPVSHDSSKDWDDALKVAEVAALPAESLMEDPQMCEDDEDKRMDILTDQEQKDLDSTCFESRLIRQQINSDHVHRVVLLDKTVYNWCLTTDSSSLSSFVDCLEGLKPASIRQSHVPPTKIHRRAIIGTATTFELLGSFFEDGSMAKKLALFTPFVSGEADGVTNIGILVWAIVADEEASLYKTLIANTEFMRHKVELDDRFLPHKDGVLELGKDMHLLDLQSTSIWTTSTMELYILNLDEGDLVRIHDPAFSAKRRIVYSEERVNRMIFRTSEDEAAESEGILAAEGRVDISSQILGGAGTGKTLLMIRKIIKEDPSRKGLIVTRLPRLLNVIKTAVGDKRIGADNLSFLTYEELMKILSQRVSPDEKEYYNAFVQFERVRFDCDRDLGVSFLRGFVDEHLNGKERKELKAALVEPLTLWYAIITIKSHAKCASTKSPLSLEDYTYLPPSFGLTGDQRQLCYSLFVKYEAWREFKHYWDEMDRVMYVLKFGPSAFREDRFIPWTNRVNRFGEMDLLNKEGEPLYPFFYDIVCADEAQGKDQTSA